MRAHLKYLRYVARHKRFVFEEGRKLGLGLWQLLVHDWSKFLPSEWNPYVRFFYGEKGTPIQRRDKTGYYKPTDTGDADFDFAWLLHQKRNPHHWQWWCLPEDDPKTDWTVTAHQPEFGPYWLTYQNEPLARFETERGEDTSDAAYRLVGIAERALASAALKVLPMPDCYRREMLADWRGAGRAQGTPDVRAWYRANQHKMRLHPETRAWIENELFGSDGVETPHVEAVLEARTAA